MPIKNNYKKLTARQIINGMKRDQAKCTVNNHHRHCYCYRNHAK